MISRILPSIARQLVELYGVSSQDFSGTTLAQIPAAKRYLLVLIDGFGAELLAEYGMDFANNSQQYRITTVQPSTTAAALSSLSTGVLPSEHGVVGYTFGLTNGKRFSQTGIKPQLVKALAAKLDPRELQLRNTVFENLEKLGISTAMVAPKQFQNTVFTKAVWAGTSYFPISQENNLVEHLVAAKEATRVFPLTYLYFRGFDHAGHQHGPYSVEAKSAWQWVAKALQELRKEIDPEVVMIVTGDHGMVEVQNRIEIKAYPQLLEKVLLFGGEGRFLHIYTDRPEVVAKNWRDFCAAQKINAQVSTQASDYFETSSSPVAARLGDVIVAALDPVLFCAPERLGELSLRGAHGSITSAELEIPLLVG